MSRPEKLKAEIPSQPLGIDIVIDKDGDAWQRLKAIDSTTWRCVAMKYGGYGVRTIASSADRSMLSWQQLIVNFGPLELVHYDR